jgi:hypothetical protein
MGNSLNCVKKEKLNKRDEKAIGKNTIQKPT